LNQKYVQYTDSNYIKKIAFLVNKLEISHKKLSNTKMHNYRKVRNPIHEHTPHNLKLLISKKNAP